METYSVMIENWNVGQENGTYNCKDTDSKEVFFNNKEEAYENFNSVEIEPLFYDGETPTRFEVATLHENEIIDNEIVTRFPVDTKHLLSNDEIELINY